MKFITKKVTLDIFIEKELIKKYLKGEISDKELIDMLVKYFGYNERDAKLKVEFLNYRRKLETMKG